MTHPGGRPSQYDPKYCDEIIEFMSSGKSYTAYAGYIGVTRDTLRNWTKKNPEFLCSYKKAGEKAEAYWEQILERFASGLDENPNLGGLCFLMKQRFLRYREDYKEEDNSEEYPVPESLREEIEE